jgi:hypothetical protein
LATAVAGIAVSFAFADDKSQVPPRPDAPKEHAAKQNRDETDRASSTESRRKDDQRPSKTAAQDRAPAGTERRAAVTVEQERTRPAAPERAGQRTIIEGQGTVRTQAGVVPPAGRIEAGATAAGPAPAGVAVGVPVTRRAFRVAEIRSPDIGIWFDPSATDSLVIADIAPTGPIARLGFQEGDRILEVNHVKVTRETDFIKLLFATKARDGRVDVLIWRKNKEMVITVEPALLREEYVAIRHDPLEDLGVVVDDRYDDRVVVWKVIPRSPAFYAGIRPGDVITRFGDHRVAARAGFGEIVADIHPGMLAIEVDRARRVRPIQIEVPRDWNSRYVSEEASAAPDAPRKGVVVESRETERESAPGRVSVEPDLPAPPQDRK